MKTKKLIAFVLIFTLFFVMSFQKETFAYKRTGWKLSSSTISYKWGASLKDGVLKTGWKNGAASWKSKTSGGAKMNFFYNSSSVNYLTRFTEADTNYYGKMLATTNSKKIVTKYEGFLNDRAVKTSNVAQSTAVHELGHALGLDHTGGTSIMNSSRNRNTMTTPQSDDIKGADSIY